MALNINAIIIAIMEYRDNYESLQGYRAHYATASEVKYISELLLDNYQCEAQLDVDFDENIDTHYFASSHGLIIPRESDVQTYEQIFNDIYTKYNDEVTKGVVFNRRIIHTLVESVKVLDMEEYDKSLEGCEQHDRTLQKVSNL